MREQSDKFQVWDIPKTKKTKPNWSGILKNVKVIKDRRNSQNQINKVTGDIQAHTTHTHITYTHTYVIEFLMRKSLLQG